jgi:PleD family two-component response regulator
MQLNSPINPLILLQCICKQLAQLFKGDIGVQSQVGKGSTFWFTAKLRRAEGQKYNGISKAIRANTKIMVLERFDLARTSTVKCIRQHGITAVGADNHRAALDLLRKEGPTSFDIILSSPVDAAALVLEEPRLQTTFLVAVNPQEGDFAATFIKCVRKPLNRAKIMDAIRKILEKTDGKDDYDSSGEDELKPADEFKEPQQQQQVQKQQRQKHRILVAEDNPVNQKVIVKQLEHLGYSSMVARNGLEALELLENPLFSFSLVLMDCQVD